MGGGAYPDGLNLVGDGIRVDVRFSLTFVMYGHAVLFILSWRISSKLLCKYIYIGGTQERYD